MVGITEISAIVAAVGVVVGVVYYIQTIRHQNKVRQTDLVIRLYGQAMTSEWEKAYRKILNAPFEDYDDFCEKYGGVLSENPVSIAADQINGFYDQLGYLLCRKLIDADMAFEMFSIARAWNRLKPIIYGARKQYDQPNIYESFEYLYNEMKKKEQKLQQSKA